MQLPEPFFKLKLEKIKQIHPPKKFLIFGERNFLSLILKNIEYFLMFPETETTKDSSYSWKQEPYKASYISENGTLTRKLEKIKNPSRKKLL